MMRSTLPLSLSEALFNTPLMAIAILDEELNFVRVNECFAQLHDREVDCLDYPPIRSGPFAIISHIMSETVEAGRARQLLSHPFSFNNKGALTYWDCSLTPIGSEDKSRQLVLSLVKSAGLKMSEEKFAKAFHASPVMISIRRLTDSRYVDVNEQWLRHTGYTLDEIIGKSTFELNIVDEETILLTKRIETTGKGVRSRSIKYRTKGGEIRDGINSLEVIEINGEPCMFSVTLDVTEQRAMERELQRLDRLNMIGQMASGLGHEIRNPLTTVRGFLQLFTNRYPDAKKHFELMISEIDRANKIITEFLALSRTKPSNLTRACLNDIVKTIDPMLQAHANQMGKALFLEMGDISTLLLDESEIRQVLLNLIHNALEACPVGERVVVRTYLKDLHVILEVQDFGCGIDPMIIDQLGTPFLTTKDDGTGLGLAITYNIVRRHGGKVDVHSTTGGTTFSVSFPGVTDSPSS